MATGAAIGGAVLSGGGQIYGGIQARKAAKKQQQMLDEQARLERSAAAFDAAEASRDFDRLMGQQKARIAGSGIELVGSPLDLIEETEKDKQDTIRNILETGRARASALQSQAGLARDAGRAALTSSIVGAFGSVLKESSPKESSQIGGAASKLACDIRLKKDIRKVGKLDNGLPIYMFRYKNDPENKLNINVMAQDVEKVIPDAVIEIDGFKHIILDKIGGELCQ